ncbi:MAG: RNA polymerase sigma factor SigZ [Bacteroidetes bacterium HGW-Bacteroidetes-17]|nr:MAG: RNA polymerase sigma factor SigZ [Bacteroidetes bacterium HGW-Bacteroidetes-17]
MDKNIEALWLKFSDKLKGFILSKVHDEAMAEDILQEVFIKIHARIDQLNDDTKIQSWIYQITRNLITDYFRETKKEIHKTQSLYHEKEEVASENAMTEAIGDMINMMRNLPPEYCEALCLTELDGLSQKAYAEQLGLNYSAAKSRVQRARTMLKDMLMNCCHYQFDKYGTVLEISPANCCCCCSAS